MPAGLSPRIWRSPRSSGQRPGNGASGSFHTRFGSLMNLPIPHHVVLARSGPTPPSYGLARFFHLVLSQTGRRLDLFSEGGIPRSRNRTTGVKVDKDDVECVSKPQGSGRRGGPDSGSVLLAINGVIAAIGGSYDGTHSVVVTVMAGCAGVATAALVVWRK